MKNTLIKFNLLLLFLGGSLLLDAQNQVLVNVVVPPPYSPNISYYSDQPNRVLVSLVNTTTQELQVYLQASFMDEDGLGVKTLDSYKPAQALTLNASSTYQLSLDEFGNLFSSSYLQYVGIDRNDIIKNQGMPEGMYRICVHVFDFSTGQPLSNNNSSCSNYFPIQYVEPPVITSPLCGDSLLTNDPQSIVINWTVVQGINSMNVVYHLRMVEMFPSERDPNEALQSAGHPDFLEASTKTNVYVIGANDPELMEGRSYAFEVQAEDESGQILFLNEGKSEACWFKYKASMPEFEIVDDDISIETQDFIHDFELIPHSSVSGRLYTKLPQEGQTFVSTGAVSLDGSQTGASTGSGNTQNTTPQDSGNESSTSNNGSSYQGFVYSGILNGGNLNFNNISFNGLGYMQGMQVLPPVGKGFINPQIINIQGGEPLKNVKVRLVLRSLVKMANGFYTVHDDESTFQYKDGNNLKLIFKDVNGNSLQPNDFFAMRDQVLDVTTTDANGNFSFDFQSNFFTGPVLDQNDGMSVYGALALRVEVVRAEFCSPDVDIYAMPGDNIELGDEVALFNTYDAKIAVNAAKLTSSYPDPFIEAGKPIPGAIVSVYRKKSEVNEVPKAVISYEGNQQSKWVSNPHGTFLQLFEGQAENGFVTLKNLMYHSTAKADGYYILRARTRTENPSQEPDNTLYNYQEEWIPANLISRVTYPFDHYINNAIDLFEPMPANHEYTKNTFTSTFSLKPLDPEIKGRVMAQSNLENIPLSQVQVELFEVPLYAKDPLWENVKNDYSNVADYIHHGFTIQIKEMKTSNAAGYFRFPALEVKLETKSNGDQYAQGPYRRILITADGYKPVVYPPLEDLPLNLKPGQLLNAGEIQMEPAQTLKGEVIDEDGNAIAAYVRLLPEGPYYKTELTETVNIVNGQTIAHQYFEMATPENNIHLEIKPLSSQYFPLDTLISTLPKQSEERILFKVKKKNHRLHLIVENSQTNKAISGVQVMVGDSLAFANTEENGLAKIKFPSPGKQFILKLTKDGYTPIQKSFNIPISQNWTNIVMFMEPGFTMQGIVREKTSAKPVAGAKVYIQLQNTDGQEVYLESTTATDGKYTLQGVPMTANSIEVHAVKSGNNPSYIGARKVFIPKPFAIPPESYDLRLQKMPGWDFSDIWGFPVVIEHFVSKSGNGISVSGYFYNLPAKSIFATSNTNAKIYFKSLKITQDAQGKIKPVRNWIETESYAIPVKINGGFAGDFRPDGQQKLILYKDGNKAKMKAPMKLDLASFKFAYDFQGDLYMGDDTTSVKLEVFNSANQNPSASSMRYIFDRNNTFVKPIEDYHVFGFNASSSLKGSYYKNGKIVIHTILHTDIPLEGSGKFMDLNIDAGNIEITKEDMDMKPNESSILSFDLEQWRVETKQAWTFDKSKDAIIIPKAIILTGAGVDADIKGLNIRPNMLIDGTIDMSGSGLSLGGIVPLELNSSVHPQFNYDAGLGHYRISLVGNNHGLPAATVSNLPAINKPLEFSSIGMLSDGSNILNLYQKVKFYNVLDMTLSQIMTTRQSFQLAGTPQLGIPGFVPATAVMTYSKQNGKLQAEIEPLAGVVDCNHNVEFGLDHNKIAQHIEQNLYTAYGTVYVKPSIAEGGAPFTLRGFLTKTPDAINIEVIKVDTQNEYKGNLTQKFYTGDHFMDVFEGNLSVQNNQWEKLWYKAATHSEGLSNENINKFVVHGGVEVSSDNIKADHIEIPGLGSLSMVYLFDETALVGNLTIDHELEMGFGKLTSGEMETRFDPHGFYMGINADIRIGADPYEGGFILGVYDASVQAVADKLLSDFGSTPPDFSSMHGFYLIGRRNLINKHFVIPITPPIEVVAKAFAEANVYLDYEHPEFSLGGYLYGYGKGGTDYLGCYIGASGEAFIEIHGGYKKPIGAYFDAEGNIVVKAGACGIEGCIGVNAQAHLSSGGECTSNMNIDSCD